MARPRLAGRQFWLALVVTVLSGCGPAREQARPLTGVPAVNLHRCADLVATAFSSPPRRVTGAYACLGPSSPIASLKGRIQNDADFEAAASTKPIWEQVRYIGEQADHGFVYEIKVAGRIAHLILWQDRDGRVSAFNVASCVFTRGCGQAAT